MLATSPRQTILMNTQTGLHEFAEGEVYFWIEQESSVHLKAVSADHDPVELTAAEARDIGNALLKVADKLDALD